MDEEILEEGDPSVPPELLELYVDLEDQNLTPEEFKEKMNDSNSYGS